MYNLPNNSNINSNKPFELSNPLQRKLGDFLLDFLLFNLFYPAKLNKNEFWRQLMDKSGIVLIRHSQFKGHHQILQCFDLLSSKEIEETFTFTIQRFTHSKLIDRQFIFVSTKENS